MRVLRPSTCLACALLTAAVLAPASVAHATYETFGDAPLTQGQLRVTSDSDDRGATASSETQRISPKTALFVLEKTVADVEISGVLARVRLEQVFLNPFTERLEATYVFPLPESAAVDGYSIEIGETVIQGVVKKLSLIHI